LEKYLTSNSLAAHSTTQEQTKSYKAGVVSLDNKYNEKFVQSHTDSLPLEDEVKKNTHLTLF
jgi:hypothetical protein